MNHSPSLREARSSIFTSNVPTQRSQAIQLEVDAASSRLWAAARATTPVTAGPHRPPAVVERAQACVVGAAVADAASMSLHWVYDLDVLRAKVNEKSGEARCGVL